MTIELIPWNQSLQAELIEVCNNLDRTHLSNRIPDPYTHTDADWWLTKAADREGISGIYRAICYEGKIVGNITVEQKSDVCCKDAELGYALMRNYASRGIMTEALRQMLMEAFESLDLRRLTALVHAPNKASCRVLEKNGFILEGCMKQAVYKQGAFIDLLIFGRLA